MLSATSTRRKAHVPQPDVNDSYLYGCFRQHIWLPLLSQVDDEKFERLGANVGACVHCPIAGVGVTHHDQPATVRIHAVADRAKYLPIRPVGQ